MVLLGAVDTEEDVILAQQTERASVQTTVQTANQGISQPWKVRRGTDEANA